MPTDLDSTIRPVWLEFSAVGGHGYLGAEMFSVTIHVVEESNHGVVSSLVEVGVHRSRR